MLLYTTHYNKTNNKNIIFKEMSGGRDNRAGSSQQPLTGVMLDKLKDRLSREELPYQKVQLKQDEQDTLLHTIISIDTNLPEVEHFWLQPTQTTRNGTAIGRHPITCETEIPLSYGPLIEAATINEPLKDSSVLSVPVKANTRQEQLKYSNSTDLCHSKQSLKGTRISFGRANNDSSDEDDFAQRRLTFQQHKTVSFDQNGLLKDLKTILITNGNRHQYQTTKHVSLDLKGGRCLQDLLKESSSEEDFDRIRRDFQTRKHCSLDARITFKLNKVLHASSTDSDEENDVGEYKRLIHRPKDITKPIIVDLKDLIVSEEDSEEDFHLKKPNFQKYPSKNTESRKSQRFYKMDEIGGQMKNGNIRHVVPFVRQITEDGKAKFEVYRPTTNPIFIWTQVLAAFSVSMGSLVVGFSSAYTSPALVSMTDRNVTSFEVTKQSGSWVGGIMPLAGLVGGIAGGPFIEYFGRRNTILATAVPFIIAWLLIACAVHVAMVLVGRAVTGFCVGIASLSLPVYLGEAIQPEVRGTLGLLPTAFGNIGILLCFVAGTYMDWSELAFLGGALPIPFLILMFVIPETPHWYVSRHLEERARKSLQWLRGRDADIEPELKGLMLSQADDDRQTTQNQFMELFKRNNLKPLFISLGLMFFQQFSGINAVIFYTVSIFQDAGSTIDDNICTIIVGAVNFIAIFIATVLIDRLGRKVLLYISIVTMFITLFVLGGFFYCKSLHMDLANVGWLPLASFVIYVVGFSLGFGPIPWLMMGEILPAKIRGSAASVATAFNWTCTFIVTKTYQDMIDSIGAHGTFWLFGTICFIGLFFTIFCVPETQGKSLEDIERKMMGRVRRMSSMANIKPLSFNM